MKNQSLEIKTTIQILKPANEVFEAIVDPVKMSKYFISKGSTRMEEGKQIIWRFPEFDMEFPVRVQKIEKDKYISYHWDIDDIEHLVEMTLTPKENNSTLVSQSHFDQMFNVVNIPVIGYVFEHLVEMT